MSDPHNHIPTFDEIMQEKDTVNGKIPSFDDIMTGEKPKKKVGTLASGIGGTLGTSVLQSGEKAGQIGSDIQQQQMQEDPVGTVSKDLNNALKKSETPVTSGNDMLAMSEAVKQHNNISDLTKKIKELPATLFPDVKVARERLNTKPFDPDNKTDVLAKNIVVNHDNNKAAISDAFKKYGDIHEAAAQLISGQPSSELSEAKLGKVVDQLLESPEAKELASEHQDFASQFYGAKNWVLNSSYGQSKVAQEIGQKLEDERMTGWLYANPSVKKVDKAVKMLKDEGKWDSNRERVYQSQLRPIISLPGGADKVIPLTDVAHQFGYGVYSGAEGLESGTRDILNKTVGLGFLDPHGNSMFQNVGLMETNQDRTKRLEQEQFSTPSVEAKRATTKYIGGAANFAGQMTPLIIGAAAGIPETANLVFNFEGRNADKARELFKNDVGKQNTYTFLSTLGDAFFLKALPTKQAAAGVKKLFADDMAKLTEDLATKRITEGEAKQTVIQKLGDYAFRVGKQNTNTANVLTAYNWMHNGLDAAFGGRKFNVEDEFNDALKGYGTNWLKGSFLSSFAALNGGQPNSFSAKKLLELTDNADDTRELINKSKLSDADKKERLENLDHIEGTNEFLKTKNITPERRGEYLKQSIIQKTAEQKASNAPDKTIATEDETKAKIAEIEKERILNPEISNTEHIEKLYDFLPKGMQTMLSTEGKFDPSKVGEFIKFIAQQAHGLTQDWKKSEVPASNLDVIPESVKELANERWKDEIEKATATDAHEKRGFNPSVDEDVTGQSEIVEHKSRIADTEIAPEEIQRQMKPITDKMAEIEEEASHHGIILDWDYDGEILVTDKNGEQIEPEDVPENVKGLIADYEKATLKLDDYDHPSFVKAIEESRKLIKGENVEGENVGHDEFIKNEIEKEHANIDAAIEGANMDDNKEFEGKGIDELLEDKQLLKDDPAGYFLKIANQMHEYLLDERVQGIDRNHAQQLFDEFTGIYRKMRGIDDGKLNEASQDLFTKNYDQLTQDQKGEALDEANARIDVYTEEELQKQLPSNEANQQDTESNEPVSTEEAKPSEAGVDKNSEDTEAENPPPKTPIQEPLEAGSEGEPNTVGLAQRVREKRADVLKLTPAEIGIGWTKEEALQRGRELIQDGIDPEDVLEDFEKDGKISDDTIAVVQARTHELARKTDAALDRYGKDSPEYNDAVWQEKQFAERTKKMQTVWNRAGVAQQGDIDINTGSVSGLQRAYGKEFTAKQTKQAKELSEKVSTLEKEVEDLKESLTKALNKNAGQSKPRSVKLKGKELADKIRGLKTKQDKAQANLAAIPVAIYDGALELIATSIENGAEFLEAVQKGVEHLKSQGYLKTKKDEKEFSDHVGQTLYDDLFTHFVDKKDNKFSPQEAKAIWDYAREQYLDKDGDYGNMIRKTATDLGLTTNQVRYALESPKEAKKITNEMYKKQYQRNIAIQRATKWVEGQKEGKLKKAVSFVPRAFFRLATFGHGTVGAITHAGTKIFTPSDWAAYWPNAIKQFKFAYGNTAKYEKAMEDLVNDPDYIFWKRAGLAVDPKTKYDDYQTFDKMFGKLGMAGDRGFNALKTMRLDVAKAEWNRRSEFEKSDPNTAKEIATLVNHSTGTSKVPLPESANTIFFAARLEASRWARILKQPFKTIATLTNLKNATPAQKAAMKIVARKTGEIMATYLTALFANQGLLIATGSNQRVNFTNPLASDWLKFKVAGKTLDFTGGMISALGFIVRLADIGMQSKEQLKGETREKTIFKTVGKYARGKLSPFAGTVYDVASHHDYAGNTLPFSSDKPSAGAHKLSWGQYGMEKAPIPVSEAVQDVQKEMEKKGISKPTIKQILGGIFIGTAVGGTGVRIGEEPAQRPTPFTDEDYKKPAFKKVKEEWKMELPNTSHTSEVITDEEKGTKKKLSDYPKDIQDKYDQAHNDNLESELQSVFDNGAVYVKIYKDAEGKDQSTVSLGVPEAGNYEEKKVDNLTKSERAQVLRRAQDKATAKTKKELFNQE